LIKPRGLRVLPTRNLKYYNLSPRKKQTRRLLVSCIFPMPLWKPTSIIFIENWMLNQEMRP